MSNPKSSVLSVVKDDLETLERKIVKLLEREQEMGRRLAPRDAVVLITVQKSIQDVRRIVDLASLVD